MSNRAGVTCVTTRATFRAGLNSSRQVGPVRRTGGAAWLAYRSATRRPLILIHASPRPRRQIGQRDGVPRARNEPCGTREQVRRTRGHSHLEQETDHLDERAARVSDAVREPGSNASVDATEGGCDLDVGRLAHDRIRRSSEMRLLAQDSSSLARKLVPSFN